MKKPIAGTLQKNVIRHHLTAGHEPGLGLVRVIKVAYGGLVLMVTHLLCKQELGVRFS